MSLKHFLKKITYCTVLFISIAVNIVFYLSNRYPSISSASEPFWVDYGDDTFSYQFSGYLKWNDKSKQAVELKQFWFIELEVLSKGYRCKINDIWEEPKIFDKRIAITSPNSCELLNYDKENKIITVKYQDVILIMTKSEVTVTSKQKDEAGGMHIVPGYKL